MQALEIQICDSPQEAPNYNRDEVDIRSIEITKAVIVKGGMVSGKPTVDLQMQTKDGCRFVAMLTGELVKGLAAAVQGVEQR